MVLAKKPANPLLTLVVTDAFNLSMIDRYIFMIWPNMDVQIKLLKELIQMMKKEDTLKKYKLKILNISGYLHQSRLVLKDLL